MKKLYSVLTILFLIIIIGLGSWYYFTSDKYKIRHIQNTIHELLTTMEAWIDIPDKSDLPEEMPPSITFEYSRGGGMIIDSHDVVLSNEHESYYEFITEIHNGQMDSDTITEKKHILPLDTNDLTNVYNIFRAQAFDKIKTNKIRGVIYDKARVSMKLEFTDEKNNIHTYTYSDNGTTEIAKQSSTQWIDLIHLFEQIIKPYRP